MNNSQNYRFTTGHAIYQKKAFSSNKSGTCLILILRQGERLVFLKMPFL